jgi:hypothetical protein
MYYFVQAGIERSKQFATLAEAEREVFFVLQRHNAVAHIKQGTKGSRKTTLVKTVFAACVA